MIIDLIALTVSLCALLAETILYPGFWQARIHISINTLISLYLAYLALNVVGKKENNFHKFWLFKFFSILLFIFASTLYFFEYHFFPNYSFSHFHINPLAISLATSILVIYIYRPLIKKSFLLTLSTYLLVVFSLSNSPAAIGNSFSGLYYAISTRNLTYDQKMAMEIGPNYYYFQFIKSIVKENESITLPPWQLPWRYTGDLNYIRYFLYPRTLYSNQLNWKEFASDYIILTSETENGMDATYPFWPNFPVKAKELLIYDFDTKSYQIIKKDFDPKDWEGKKPWGLIKYK